LIKKIFEDKIKIKLAIKYKIIKNMETNIYDLIIIGSGPAGLTAGIYASRYKLKTLIIGKINGGLMTESHKICNFPTEENITGLDLSEKMEKNAKVQGAEIINKEITNITEADGLFTINSSDNIEFISRSIILAYGTVHRYLGLPKEKELLGKGISYCATCDGMFFKNKTVAVIGGSNSALTSALYLADIAEKVYLIYRREKLRGEPVWIENINQSKNIEVLLNSQAIELIGENKLEKIKISDKSELAVDGLFVEIGTEPRNYDFIKNLKINTDEKGYIEINQAQQTSRTGIWAAGDLTTGSNNFRQIITACAEGAIAAESVFKYLKTK
jgi:thioredoxin reductase (NADPH)